MKKQYFTSSKISIDAINVSTDGWQQVCPYCEAPYWNERGVLEGVQVINYEIAQNLVSKFNSNFKKLKDFFVGANGNIPFYNGHPDHPATELRDTNIYAEADALEAREDGLWAHIIKHDCFNELKDKLGSREISPRWSCEVRENGLLIPNEIISFGLVEKGNLPNADVMNSYNNRAYDIAEKEALYSIAEQLGIDKSVATFEAVNEGVKSLQTSVAELQSGAINSDAKIQELEKENSAKDEQITSLNSVIKELENALKTRNREFGSEKLERAFDEGDISIEEKDGMVEEFGDNFEQALSKLSNMINENKKKKSACKNSSPKKKDIENSAPVENSAEDQIQNATMANGANNVNSFWDMVDEAQKTHSLDRIEAIKYIQRLKSVNTLVGNDN